MSSAEHSDDPGPVSDPTAPLDGEAGPGGSATSAVSVPSPSPVEEARALLAATDPASYYRMLSGLARQGHHSVLQEHP